MICEKAQTPRWGEKRWDGRKYCGNESVCIQRKEILVTIATGDRINWPDWHSQTPTYTGQNVTMRFRAG